VQALPRVNPRTGHREGVASASACPAVRREASCHLSNSAAARATPIAAEPGDRIGALRLYDFVLEQSEAGPGKVDWPCRRNVDGRTRIVWGSREFGYVLVGRQHRVRTTPVPAKAAQTHQDDDNAGGDGGRPRRALVQSMVGARAQPIGGVCEGWVTSR